MTSREQLLNKLREHKFKYQRSATKVDLWRKKGHSTQRVFVKRSKLLSDITVRQILRDIGCSEKEIEDFLRAAKG